MASDQDIETMDSIAILDGGFDGSDGGGGGGDSGGGGGNPETQKLVIANQVVITTTLVILMIAMGCTMTVQEVLKNLKRPVGIIIGACCQFILMPLLGFTLAHLFDLSDELALGTLAIATCPGGAFSNILTYWTEGDTCLSVCMTTCSTIIGIGMMPFNLYVYSRSWAKAAAVIPYVDIVIALTVILLPCGFGMLLRWKAPKVANVVARVGSTIAFLGILAVLGIVAAINPAAYTSSWRPYIVAITYPLVAFGLGYVIPYCFRQSNAKCRTIAFETGVQNTALALTIINLLLARGIQANVLGMLVIPSLHGTTVVLEFTVLALSYRWYMRRKRERDALKEKQKEKAQLEKQVEDLAWSQEGTDNPALAENGNTKVNKSDKKEKKEKKEKVSKKGKQKEKTELEKRIEDWALSHDGVHNGHEISKFAYDNPGLGSRGSSLDRAHAELDDTVWTTGYWDEPTPYGTYRNRADTPESPWRSAIKYANAVDRSKGENGISEQGVQTDTRQRRLYDVEVGPDGSYTQDTLGLEGWRGAHNGIRTASVESDVSSGFDYESRGSTMGDRTPKPIRFTIKDKPSHETEV